MNKSPDNEYNYSLNWDFDKNKFVCSEGHEESFGEGVKDFDREDIEILTEELLTNKKMIAKLFLAKYEEQLDEETKKKIRSIQVIEEI